MKKRRILKRRKVARRPVSNESTTDNVDTAQVLSQTLFMGYGFDIFGEDNSNSKVTPLLDAQKAATIPFELLGTSYEIPAYILAVEETVEDYHEGFGKTRNEFQEKIAAKAKVKGSYGAFSGEMTFAYGSLVSKSVKYVYSWKNYYRYIAYMDLVLDDEDDYRSNSFIQAIDALPDELSEATYPDFADFFTSFGSYYISRMYLGGTFKFYCGTSKEANLSESNIETSVNVQYSSLTSTGSVNAELDSYATYASYNSNTAVDMSFYGGDPALQDVLRNLNPSEDNPGGPDAFDNWVDSIEDAPTSFDYELTEISELCGDKKDIVREALEMYLEKGLRTLTINMAQQDLPVVTLQSPLVPEAPATGDGPGWQLIILDRSDPTPDGVLWNKYYELADVSIVDSPGYAAANEALCNEIVDDIYDNEFDSSQNFIILAGFRLLYDGNCPNWQLYSLLSSAGAGVKLNTWRNTTGAVSPLAVPVPTKYSLVGIFGTDTGDETLGIAPEGYTVDTEIFFYNEGAPNYTMGPGETTGDIDTQTLFAACFDGTLGGTRSSGQN